MSLQREASKTLPPTGLYEVAAQRGLSEEQRLGRPVQIPLEELAFVTEDAIAELLEPHALNSGNVVDIYQTREDDFKPRSMMEISYQNQHNEMVQETVYVDNLIPNSRPRICVSLAAVRAMHRAIAVLTRKVDNLSLTLKSCREHYYKELIYLRHGRLPNTEHEAYWFNPKAYEDNVTKALVAQRVSGEVMELEEKLLKAELEVNRLTDELDIAQNVNIFLPDMNSRLRKMVSSQSWDIVFDAIRKTFENDLHKAEGFYDHLTKNLGTWRTDFYKAIGDMLSIPDEDEGGFRSRSKGAIIDKAAMVTLQGELISKEEIIKELRQKNQQLQDFFVDASKGFSHDAPPGQRSSMASAALLDKAMTLQKNLDDKTKQLTELQDLHEALRKDQEAWKKEATEKAFRVQKLETDLHAKQKELKQSQSKKGKNKAQEEAKEHQPPPSPPLGSKENRSPSPGRLPKGRVSVPDLASDVQTVDFTDISGDKITFMLDRGIFSFYINDELKVTNVSSLRAFGKSLQLDGTSAGWWGSNQMVHVPAGSERHLARAIDLFAKRFQEKVQCVCGLQIPEDAAFCHRCGAKQSGKRGRTRGQDVAIQVEPEELQPAAASVAAATEDAAPSEPPAPSEAPAASEPDAEETATTPKTPQSTLPTPTPPTTPAPAALPIGRERGVSIAIDPQKLDEERFSSPSPKSSPSPSRKSTKARSKSRTKKLATHELLILDPSPEKEAQTQWVLDPSTPYTCLINRDDSDGTDPRAGRLDADIQVDPSELASGETHAHGHYRLCDKVVVTETPSSTSNRIAMLRRGARVNVVEIADVPEECAIKARIEEPRGWIALLQGTEDIVRRAVKVPADATDEDMDALEKPIRAKEALAMEASYSFSHLEAHPPRAKECSCGNLFPAGSEFCMKCGKPRAVCEGDEYEITLIKARGSELGLQLDTGRPNYIAVRGIRSDGLVGEWNEFHPDAQVRPGDRILEVNGIRGKPQELAIALNKSQRLKLKLWRGIAGWDDDGDIDVQLVREKEDAPLGMTIDSGNPTFLRVESLEPGLMSDWNRDNPESRVQVQDRIIQVNQVRGHAQLLLAELGKGHILRLKVRPSAKEQEELEDGYEYDVVLTKPKGSKGGDIGMDLDSSDPNRIRIEGLRPGLLTVWNVDHPDLAVKSGDRLIRINGEVAKLSRIEHHLQGAHQIRMKLWRPLLQAEFSFVSPNVIGEKPGLEWRVTAHGLVKVSRVLHGPIRKWNKLHPDFEVKPGDTLVQVNNVEGDPVQLTSELSSGAARIRLRFRRELILPRSSSSLEEEMISEKNPAEVNLQKEKEVAPVEKKIDNAEPEPLAKQTCDQEVQTEHELEESVTEEDEDDEVSLPPPPFSAEDEEEEEEEEAVKEEEEEEAVKEEEEEEAVKEEEQDGVKEVDQEEEQGAERPEEEEQAEGQQRDGREEEQVDAIPDVSVEVPKVDKLEEEREEMAEPMPEPAGGDGVDEVQTLNFAERLRDVGTQTELSRPPTAASRSLSGSLCFESRPQTTASSSRRPATAASSRRPATVASGRRPGTAASGRRSTLTAGSRPVTAASGSRPATMGSSRKSLKSFSRPGTGASKLVSRPATGGSVASSPKSAADALTSRPATAASVIFGNEEDMEMVEYEAPMDDEEDEEQREHDEYDKEEDEEGVQRVDSRQTQGGWDEDEEEPSSMDAQVQTEEYDGAAIPARPVSVSKTTIGVQADIPGRHLWQPRPLRATPTTPDVDRAHVAVQVGGSKPSCEQAVNTMIQMGLGDLGSFFDYMARGSSMMQGSSTPSTAVPSRGVPVPTGGVLPEDGYWCVSADGSTPDAAGLAAAACAEAAVATPRESHAAAAAQGAPARSSRREPGITVRTAQPLSAKRQRQQERQQERQQQLLQQQLLQQQQQLPQQQHPQQQHLQQQHPQQQHPLQHPLLQHPLLQQQQQQNQPPLGVYMPQQQRRHPQLHHPHPTSPEAVPESQHGDPDHEFGSRLHSLDAAMPLHCVGAAAAGPGSSSASNAEAMMPLRLGRGIAVVHEDGAASAPVEGGLAAAAVAAAAAAAGGGGSVAAAVAARAAAGGAVDAYSLQASQTSIAETIIASPPRVLIARPRPLIASVMQDDLRDITGMATQAIEEQEKKGGILDDDALAVLLQAHREVTGHLSWAHPRPGLRLNDPWRESVATGGVSSRNAITILTGTPRRPSSMGKPKAADTSLPSVPQGPCSARSRPASHGTIGKAVHSRRSGSNRRQVNLSPETSPALHRHRWS